MHLSSGASLLSMLIQSHSRKQENLSELVSIHRIINSGRNLWRPSSPTHCSGEPKLKFRPGCSRAFSSQVLSICKDGNSTGFLGPWSRAPHSETLLPDIYLKVHWLQLVFIACCLFLCTSEKRLVLSSLQLWLDSSRYPLKTSLWNNPWSPSLSLHALCCSALIMLVTLCWMISSSSDSFFLWRDQNQIQCSQCYSKVPHRGQ